MAGQVEGTTNGKVRHTPHLPRTRRRAACRCRFADAQSFPADHIHFRLGSEGGAPTAPAAEQRKGRPTTTLGPVLQQSRSPVFALNPPFLRTGRAQAIAPSISVTRHQGTPAPRLQPAELPRTLPFTVVRGRRRARARPWRPRRRAPRSRPRPRTRERPVAVSRQLLQLRPTGSQGCQLPATSPKRGFERPAAWHASPRQIRSRTRQ